LPCRFLGLAVRYRRELFGKVIGSCASVCGRVSSTPTLCTAVGGVVCSRLPPWWHMCGHGLEGELSGLAARFEYCG
jgi:hypothetical protein